jgi:hypothetical protein
MRHTVKPGKRWFLTAEFVVMVLVATVWTFTPGTARMGQADILSLHEMTEKGDIEAQVDPGNMYDNGQGLVQDHREAAEQVLAEVRVNPVDTHAGGQGLTQEHKEAAEQKLAEVQVDPGNMYDNDQGISQDHNEVAEQKLTEVQVGPGDMYDNNQRIPEDNLEGYRRLPLAVAQGHAAVPRETLTGSPASGSGAISEQTPVEQRLADGGDVEVRQTQETENTAPAEVVDDPNDQAHGFTAQIAPAFLVGKQLYRTYRHDELTPAEVLAQLSMYSAVWQSQNIVVDNSVAAFDYMRANSSIMLLHYDNMETTWTAPCAPLVYSTDYEYIDQCHPEWFLAKVDGADLTDPNNRILSPYSDSSNDFYYVDQANPDFQEWSAEQILHYVSGDQEGLALPYAGLAFDCANLYSCNPEVGYEATWKYAGVEGNAALKAGRLAYLTTVYNKLHPLGYKIVVNGGGSDFYDDIEAELWAGMRQACDGVMHEWVLPNAYWGGETAYKWNNMMIQHERNLAAGLISWWCTYPAGYDAFGKTTFRYAYCSFLLTKVTGKSFFTSDSDRHAPEEQKIGPTRDPEWHDEYDINLGSPTGSRYEQDGCWLRNYTNGIVIVNTSGTAQTVTLNTSYEYTDETDDNSYSVPATSFELAPKTGKILLKV